MTRPRTSVKQRTVIEQVHGQRAPKWRRVTAAFALTAICGLGIAAFIPSLGAADTTSSHAHGDASTGVALESAGSAAASTTDSSAGLTVEKATPAKPKATPAPKPKKVTPIPDAAVVDSTLGAGPETSLQAAASAPDAPVRNEKALKGKRGDIDPAAALAESSTDLGGCLAEYGAAGQCLPVVPPSQSAHVQEMVAAGIDPNSMTHQWTCSEVRTYFRGGLPVREAGVDPQELDRNADGTACGKKD